MAKINANEKSKELKKELIEALILGRYKIWREKDDHHNPVEVNHGCSSCNGCYGGCSPSI